MKASRALLFSVVVLAVVAIVLPAVRNVHHFRTYTIGNNAVVLQADGGPIPPFPPSVTSHELVADGGPIPPFPPRVTSRELIADGGPIPPFPPGQVFVAHSVA
jgi:hypothetical protein